MSIANLRKLLQGNEEYPPTQDLWYQIVKLAKQSKDEGKVLDIREKMAREVDQYKPNLPEPTITRIFFQGNYYYLDGKNKIYRPDDGNPLVGNYVGEIVENRETKKLDVILNKEVVFSIESVSAEEQIKYEKYYYVDPARKVYRALHPQHRYIYQIGKLNSENKIELI